MGATAKPNEKFTPEDAPLLLCRYGSFVLASAEAESVNDLVHPFVRALDTDPRVSDIHEPRRDVKADRLDAKYPVPTLAKLEEGDYQIDMPQMNGFLLRRPLCFEVRVPTRQQKAFVEDEEPPSDKYLVRWDGEVILVAWPASLDARSPVSGGHVVYDVMADTAEKCGFTFFAQGCVPGCTYLFAHRTLRAIPARDKKPPERRIEVKSPTTIDLIVPVATLDPHDLAERAFLIIRHALHPLAGMKNYSLRILNAESETQLDVATLLELLNRINKAASQKWWTRIVFLRERLRIRQQQKRLTTKIWLALADIEVNRRHWWQSLGFLEREAEKHGLSALVAPEHEQDTPLIRTLDMGFARQVLDDVSRRSEASSLALATLVGGLSGGVVGAVVGFLFS